MLSAQARLLLIITVAALLGLFIYRARGQAASVEGFKSQSWLSSLRNGLSAHSEGFATSIKDQVAALSARFDPVAGARRPVTDLLATAAAPPADEQCLVNFTALGALAAGYTGPFDNGYMDPDAAINIAVKAGCRVFVFELDYIDDCTTEAGQPTYFPKLVFRDVRGRLRTNPERDATCQTLATSNIRRAAQAIANYAFASQTQNRDDPVIVVLYSHRMPPKEADALDYMSNIARALGPLIPRHVDNLVHGGTFSRQKQEGQLLINNIADYAGRVLIFANMDTTPFREAPPSKYKASEDLDYLVNLRLSYAQTQLGVTPSQQKASFGTLDTTGSFLSIPSDKMDSTAKDIKLKWTILLPTDPEKPADAAAYKTLTDTLGVHCVPLAIWDDTNTFMFGADTFKTYSFIPKPKELRYRKPPVQVPQPAKKEMDANGGKLRAPVVSS